MPTVSGVAIATHALNLGVPVLMMTGEPQLKESFTLSGIPFVAKPFHIRDIVAPRCCCAKPRSATRSSRSRWRAW
jgi:hypothetical protein